MSTEEARQLQRDADHLISRKTLGFIKKKSSWDKAVPQFEKAAKIYEVGGWPDNFN